MDGVCVRGFALKAEHALFHLSNMPEQHHLGEVVSFALLSRLSGLC